MSLNIDDYDNTLVDLLTDHIFRVAAQAAELVVRAGEAVDDSEEVIIVRVWDRLNQRIIESGYPLQNSFPDIENYLKAEREKWEEGR